MKKFLIFISFIFVFISCCITSFESNTFKTAIPAIQQISCANTSTVKNSEITTDYYIAAAVQFNISQYFSNIFGNMCAAIQNYSDNILKIYLITTGINIINPSTLKISYILYPRAP